MKKFLDCFENHIYRYLDQTGLARPPVIDREYRQDLNELGYEAYFTVNGFGDFHKHPDCKLEHLTELNTFFLDIDGRKSEEELEAIKAKLCPTFITETMRGYHCFWLLDEPLHKDEYTPEQWGELLAEWEMLEQQIVKDLNGDPQVKDATRILRVPNSFYWKKSGDAYLRGTENALFIIKIIHTDLSKRYTMHEVKSVFPITAKPDMSGTVSVNSAHRKSLAEKEDFFGRVNAKYPIEDRPSFIALMSGKQGTLPPEASRNMALLITATLARQSGISHSTFIRKIKDTGWHGMLEERGGAKEIENTIASAYNGAYTFGRNHPIIVHNTTDEEEKKLTSAYTAVMKDRREQDKVRYSIYEQEILAHYPHIKKNEAGVLFNYENGVYRILGKEKLSKMVLDALYEDHLWGFRSGKNVADKIMCLISIVPYIEETSDDGVIVNVKNGLLNMRTKELRPHTPDFVSLVQLPVAYDQNADYPTWERVLHNWTEGEEQEEKALMLQEYSGYCLSSSMKYGKALFLVGDGGNGKSTFADTIAMMLGEESVENLSLEDLNQQFGMSSLIGKRLNIVEEVTSNYLHSDKMKKLVSGETVTTNVKYKESFKFRSQTKFIFAVNQMPRVDDTSFGTERRLLIVNFKNNFRDNPDTALRFSEGNLMKESSGILNWAIKGFNQLEADGKFIGTDEQKLAIQEYREENSSVDGFVAECMIEQQSNMMALKDMYEIYCLFCKKDGRRAKSKIAFSKDMKMSGQKTKKFTVHDRMYGGDVSRVEGLALNGEWEEEIKNGDNNIQKSYTVKDFEKF